MSNRTQLLMAATLAALLAGFGVATPWMSVSLRAERLGDHPAPGAPTPRLLEPGRASCREAPPPPSWSVEYAELEEESDEEEEEQAPAAPLGDLHRLLGSARPTGAPGRPGPPAPPPVPLFLLCGHLVC